MVSLDINTRYLYHDKQYRIQLNKNPLSGESITLYTSAENLGWDVFNNILQYHFTNGLDTAYIVKGATGKRTTAPFYVGKRIILEKYGSEPKVLFEKLNNYIENFKKEQNAKNTGDVGLEEWIEMGTRNGYRDIFKKELMEDILNELHK